MLVTNDQGRSYDRFRERVMFPIRDKRGRVIGFGGRVLGDALPKYLNSPETDIFHKGRQLYGLYEAQQDNPEPPRLLVVEGYMDVVALAQYDINYAVASLGTSTTADHIQLLFRVTNNVICCYDGDRAGRDAAWRALEGLDSRKMPGLSLFSELVKSCLAQPGLTTGQLLEQYRGTKEAATLEKLSMWDDIADKDIAEQTFTDSLNHMFDSLLELRQEELIARDRTHGLSSEERRELWTISQELAKK